MENAVTESDRLSVIDENAVFCMTVPKTCCWVSMKNMRLCLYIPEKKTVMVEFGEFQPCVKTLADLTFGIDSYPNIAWINDRRLDLVKDHCPASEPAHNEAHGCSFASGKPFHGCRQCRNQGNVLKKNSWLSSMSKSRQCSGKKRD